MGAYTAAKAALAALTLVWARDLSRHAIRVNAVAPGFMDTPMVASLPPEFVAELVERQRISQARRHRRRIRCGRRIPHPHAADQRRGRAPRRRRTAAGADQVGLARHRPDGSRHSPPARLHRRQDEPGATRVRSGARRRQGVLRRSRPRRLPATSSRSTTRAHHPAGAIAPTSVEEVQAAVRIANQYRLPLWPISRGKNLGYGGSAPRAVRQRGARPVADEEDRVRRGATASVAARARRRLLRPLRLPAAAQAAALAVDPRQPLGLGDRQRARSRRRLHALRREHHEASAAWKWCCPTGEVVRTGMGAFSKAPDLGPLPLRLRPGVGPDVRPVELRRRHQGQHVADARAREPDGHGRRVRQARGPQGDGRHDRAPAARAAAAAEPEHRQLAARRRGADHAARNGPTSPARSTTA